MSKEIAGVGQDHLRNVPRQKRSQETTRIIVKAASLLFVENGYKKTTTIMIAEKAGISVGSLYQYFKNKEAISTYILENIFEDILTINEESAEINGELTLEEAIDRRMELTYQRLQFNLIF